MTFSIKDNRYKIDLTPTGMRTVASPYSDIGTTFYKTLIIKEVLSAEDHFLLSKELALVAYR